jgi:hypothetical protein
MPLSTEQPLSPPKNSSTGTSEVPMGEAEESIRNAPLPEKYKVCNPGNEGNYSVNIT